jgi:hypothetical protein
MVTTGKQQGLPKEKVVDAIKLMHSQNLLDIEQQARGVKHYVESNTQYHELQIKAFCQEDDKKQYLGILDTFMKSTTEKDIARDKEFLSFALKLLDERAIYKSDSMNKFYEQSKEVLEYIV